ncbi:single-stranded DNA-binding protein [uncultured Alsobacter sp.]|uniref:single-stranded DNA-binding protein n=1 Tax=uncultured Alsobacter sp. TaxID=1748258 RepID=UPI0025F53342|nr:single-stranded DNA-binding protein [uncultured Alsobacter sp.]
MSINRAILLGNVGKDPEIRTMNNGDKVATFSLATSEYWKDKATGERKETTDWHTIVVFNQNIIPVIEQYVEKGGRVSVEGAIKTRKYQDRDGHDRWTTEIVVGRFDGKVTLEGKPSGGSQRDEHGYGNTSTRDEGRGGGGGGDFGRRSYGGSGGRSGGSNLGRQKAEDTSDFKADVSYHMGKGLSQADATTQTRRDWIAENRIDADGYVISRPKPDLDDDIPF